MARKGNKLLLISAVLIDCSNNPEPEYWNKISKESLYKSKQLFGNDSAQKAKNVILFLGDGMGMPSISAARLLKKQLKNNSDAFLIFESFSHSALIKTYNIDFAVPDSAATGTAFCSGVKAKRGTIGLNGHVPFQSNDCKLIQANHVKSVFEKAAENGKSVGVVTTADIADATPAATYAHVSSRYHFTKAPPNCKDIVQQLVNHPNIFNVFLGGGKNNFLPKQENGTREDNENLFEKWKKRMINLNLAENEYQLIETRTELTKINQSTKLKYLLGIFAPNHLHYDQARNGTDEPSLEEMTMAAINVLKKNPNGFILMVEGAQIDKAHHANHGYHSLYELLAFDKAIRASMNLVNRKETLIIVTADHSHSFAHVGDSIDENPGINKTNIFDVNEFPDSNKNYFTKLLYATGPGYKTDKKITNDQIHDPNYQQMSAVPLSFALHGGDDVAAYATGPGSKLLAGTQEQTVIAHLMEFSSCLGRYENETHCHNSARSKFNSNFIVQMVIVIYQIIKNIIM